MNSFSRRWHFWSLTVFLLMALLPRAQAIVITGIYTGSCQRKLGVILGVNSYNLKVLTLDGQLESFPRYQVVQLVTYSVEDMPFLASAPAQIRVEAVPAFKVSTLVNLQEKTLVVGYPIDFTNEKIAFLTNAGGEILIDKMSISHLERLETFAVTKNGNHGVSDLNFGHSYAFQACEKNKSVASSSIYPEQILSEPLTIKRELDRLQHGFDLVDNYLDEQSFYAKPLIYANKTRLGIWQSFGSRYGRSKNRTNDFTPILNNEFASDIYSYQRIFSTGSQPQSLFEHEEAQTQALYAFKASYFHFLAYIDPNLILTGTNYKFRMTDLNNGDVKFSSMVGFGLGFDYGNWQFGFISSTIGTGLNWNGTLYSADIPLSKLHLTYTHFLDQIEILVGSGKAADIDRIDSAGTAYPSFVKAEVQHLRLNYHRILSSAWTGTFSYISNAYNFSQSLPTTDEYYAKSQSLSTVLSYSFSKRFSADTLLSLEQYKGDLSSQTYPKFGTSIHLFF